MSIRTIGNNILVKEPEVVEKKSKGGLILTSDTTSNRQPEEYTVIAVGPDTKVVKAGDIVVAPKRVGEIFSADNETYRVFSEDSVWAVK